MGSAAGGNDSVKAAPFPSSDATAMLPACSSTMLWVSERPSPVPAEARLVEK